ncbi:hypothetical protein [Nannocystis pusilla]|uniref:hypothetical protein n=1 Tax=Nannocystis pusilla TaxID=889268 RepID=UPI003BEF5DBC
MPPSRRLVALALACALACGPGDDGSTASATENATTAGTDTGATGTSAPTSTSTSGPAPSGPECQEDADCVLINNCCECDPKPATAEVAACEGNCLQPTCDALSLWGAQAACRSGICEFAGMTCSDGPVACDQAMPQCPAGTVNTVQDDCWAGCMHPRYCEGGGCTPGSCGDGWTCVSHQSGASTCALLPAACAGEPTCACLQPYFAEFCPGSCGDVEGGVQCQDGG